jgi:multiple sugar transport system substrate-binding protein
MQPNYHTGQVIFFLSALTCATTGLFAGCSSQDAPAPPPKPFPGVTIRVAVSADPIARAFLNRHGNVWADRSGGRIELVGENADCDVHVFPPADIGKTAGRLAPLDLTPSRGKDPYEYSRLLLLEIEHNMLWGGSFFAVPLLGESLFCVYRADLLGDPRHRAALETRFKAKFHRPLSPNGPATWQQVAEIADYFSNEPTWIDGEHATVPRTSLPPLAASSDGLDREFNAIAASFVRRAINQEKAASLNDREKSTRFFSYQIDADTGAAAVANPGFVAALNLMKRLRAYRPKESSTRPVDAFRSGKAVLAFATLADLAGLQDASSPVRDKFGVCRVPGSDVAYDAATRNITNVSDPEGNLIPYHGHGGWMGGIDASTPNRPAARDLLLFLSSPSVSQEAVCEPQWASGPTRLNHLENRSFWFNYGLSPEHTNQLVNALEGYYHPTLLNPAYRLSIAAERDYLKVFDEKIRPALEQDKPAELVLQELAHAWDGLAPDRAARKAEYRKSQGLR